MHAPLPTLQEEFEVDNFAGGGGASTGIEMALGRPPKYAINHDRVALAMHQVNHPGTHHVINNVWKVDPDEIEGPIGLGWFSPDCTDHSKAKGGKPVRKHIRDLAWVVIRWAKRRAGGPRVIILENVEEFQGWGPVITGPDGVAMRCPDRKGQTFKKFVRALRKLGYAVEWRELRACDYGAPTVRKRLFLIARNDGQPVVWPEPTHGKPGTLPVTAGNLAPWRTAAEIIDWSLPCPSIFDTSAEIMAKHGIRAIRPLAENTMARIARGVKRYVLDAATPFIVPITHVGDQRVHGLDEPARTVTTAQRGEHALVAPVLARTAHGEVGKGGKRRGRGAHPLNEPAPTALASRDLAVVAPLMVKNNFGDKPHYAADEPVRTIVAGGSHHMVVAPALVNTRNGERDGQEPRVRDVAEPHATVSAIGSQGALMAAHLSTMRNADKPFNGANEPAHTVTAGGARPAVVAAFLNKHNAERPGHDAREPLATVVADGAHHSVSAAFLAQHNTDMVGHHPAEPVSTIVQKGCTQAVVSAGMVNMKGSERAMREVAEPVPTICASTMHAAEVRAFLTKYYGPAIGQDAADPLHTMTAKPRFGVVTVLIGGEPYVIVDIGMRMLTPRELFRAQGFPDGHVIDRTIEGAAITKTDQIRMCGNSVCPQVAAALVKANYAPREVAPRASDEFRLIAAE